MPGFGVPSHLMKHDMASVNDHDGDWFNAMLNAGFPLTGTNPAVDTATMLAAILAAIKGLDWQESVLSRWDASGSVYPVNPAVGDRYLCIEQDPLMGGWLKDNIYECVTALTWVGAEITVPNEGFTLVVENEDMAYTYTTGGWKTLGAVIDHAALIHRAWSEAGHVMDAPLDMNTNQINELANGILSTDGINKSQISEPKQAIGYYVSNARGTTEALGADGSSFNPYNDIPEAIAKGVANGDVNINIKLDARSTYLYPGFTAPDNSHISISSDEPLNATFAMIALITLGNTSVLRINNLTIDYIRQGDTPGFTQSAIYVEESIIEHITDFALTGNPTLLTGYFVATRTGDVNVPRIKAMANAYGFVFHQYNKMTIFDTLYMNTKQIKELANGTLSTDAMAFGQRYADSEARAAIGGLLDSTGELLKGLNTNGYSVYHDDGDTYLSAGAHYDGANWIADAITASILYLSITGATQTFYNTGLTPTVAFIPTKIYEMSNAGAPSFQSKVSMTGSIEQGAALQKMDVVEYVGDAAADHILTKLLGILPVAQDYMEVWGGEDATGQFGKGFIFRHHKATAKWTVYYSTSGAFDGTEIALFEIDSAGNVAVTGTVDGRDIAADGSKLDTMRADVTLAGVAPVDADVTGWATGDRGHGIGTTAREFYMVKRGTAVKWTELS